MIVFFDENINIFIYIYIFRYLLFLIDLLVNMVVMIFYNVKFDLKIIMNRLYGV